MDPMTIEYLPASMSTSAPVNSDDTAFVRLAAVDAILVEAVWAMKQLEFYLPKQLDTEASKTFDRLQAFLASPTVTDHLKRQGGSK